ncbi:beclin 1 [Chlorella sorokiniana]|uniref:Beclin 1 n=1 Tax=Chlorella sorokiniana TaxID=3076 RepID=A0A2P6TBZ8_CHLSO|nr:beclin 1 [Chlorella sorokiniana]|eukprot:PRW18412.1 beclin 1 [Chlorella sorokiniana]
MELVLQCQQCKCRLALQDDALRSSSGSGSRLDESWLLEEGGPARSQQGSGSGSGAAAGADLAAAAAAAPRRLDESFVVLQGGRGGAGAQSALLDGSASLLVGATPGGVQRIPFDAKLRALARVYEVASEEGKVELPLCAECAAEVHKELEGQLAELQQEVAAYEAALARLEAEGLQPLDDRTFQQQLGAAQAEVAGERERLARAERELAAAQAELAAVEGRSAELSGQEERYWHSLNEFQLRLQEHMDERDALAHRLEASGAALDALKRTAVYHDVFRIWYDGACGTISGLRLGRTSQQAVEWDEINAAWGQAVLLLATLAKACGVRFRAYRLLPQGSYPQVVDVRANQTHDLFGPVNKFLCQSYDKAQVGFLTCLKEFADWLVARGASDGQGNRFALPCPIEGDKVGALTIRLMFNKDKNWTKALKHMLVDLKFVLKFALVLMERGDARPSVSGEGPGRPPVAALQREDFAGAGASTAGPAGRRP